MSRLNARIMIYENSDVGLANIYKAIRDACRK